MYSVQELWGKILWRIVNDDDNNNGSQTFFLNNFVSKNVEYVVARVKRSVVFLNDNTWLILETLLVPLLVPLPITE